MTDSLSLVQRSLQPDPWRRSVGFSADVETALARLDSAQSDEERGAVLSKWLEDEQPCLFGRVAAQRVLISYCFVTSEDVAAGDEFVQKKIQAARTAWLAEALNGSRSGFVIAVLLAELAMATPDAAVEAFARRITSLYLLQDDIDLDRIYVDDIRLEAPLPERPTWQWDVGVNYFSAQGDKRWWHDHRIPAGMALSMNSVGHMVRATHVSKAALALEKGLRVESDTEFADSTLDSLAKAHRLAMMTIHRAKDAVSGPATWLIPNPGPGYLPPCPSKLPPEIADKNYCEYRGYYHTDATLPSVYFRPDVERPQELPVQRLDFTYLIEQLADPIDSLRTGGGRRVREPGLESSTKHSKRDKALPRATSPDSV